MTREAFLKELRIALQGQIAQVQVNEHLQYYETYIIEESRKGRTEEEVIESLGDPRLIAKTIIQLTESGAYQEPEKEAPKKRFFHRFRFLKGLLGVVLVLFLIRIGMLLLPVLILGIVLYVVYLKFFGNKK